VEATSCTLSCAEDRRITRSKQALRNALVELMEEFGYENFTVNDLCARADLNRGTFYNHFKDKEQLLMTLEEEILQDLVQFRDPMESLSIPQLLKIRSGKASLPFLIDLFDYLREQGSFLRAVTGPGGDIRFAPRLRDAICTDLIQTVLHDRYRENPTAFVNYYVAFYASAYLGIITRWLETGMQESSEEMAAIATRLLFINPGEPIEL